MSEAAAKDPLVGTIIADRYRVDEKVGDGGMGAVYRVEHTHMRKRLALKVLHHDLCAYPEIVQRFEREAMAASHIEHPNVAAATDFGKLPDGSFYLVLEYVEGLDLRALLQRDKFLNPARAVHIALQILGALGRAHELGIVHRDLKPENILLVEKDGDPEFVKVLDFGIARVPIGSLGGPSKSGGADMKPLTRAGTVYGTPEYMAPEQALGHQVDGRADIYALGVLLFEMLSGARPYDDPDKIALLGAHVSKAIPRLSTRVPKEQFIPAGLEEVVTRALAKQPEDRYQDARELSETLLTLGFDAPMPITRHPSTRGPDSARRLAVETASPPPARATTQDAPGIEEPTPAAPRPASSKLPWAIAVLAVVGAAVAIFFLRRPPPPSTTPPPANPTTATSAAPSAVASVEPKELALRALGRIASGETDAGVKELEALAAAHPSDPAVLRAVAQAYSKAKRPADAVAATKKLVAAAPESASDPLLVPIFEEALAEPKAADEAVAVLSTSMGVTGAKLLYDIALNEKAPAAARGRATRALRAGKNIPVGVRAAFELRSAQTCPAKKAVLDKHKKDFDELALPALHAIAKPTCGPTGKQPCWSCIVQKELDAVIRDVESRTKK